MSWSERFFRWTVPVIKGSDNRTQEVLHSMGRASSEQVFLLNQPVGLIKSFNLSDMCISTKQNRAGEHYCHISTFPQENRTESL